MSTESSHDGGPTPRHVPNKRPGRQGGKRDENRKKRVRELCEASLVLMLEKGIESVTVDEIVKSAGVAKGSFYRYFKDKSELVDTIFLPVGQGIRAALHDAGEAIGAAESDAALMVAYIGIGQQMERTLTSYPREILLYLQECRAPRTPSRAPVSDLAADVSAGATKLTVIARDKGLLIRSASHVTALVVVGAIERMLFETLKGGELGMPPRQVAVSLINVVMNGLKP